MVDLERHYTHWRVRQDIRTDVQSIARRYNTSWNTYFDHPEGLGLDSTSVDFWHQNGRGVPLPEGKGDALVAWVLGQHVLRPVRWLIWYGWIWTPGHGWREYNAWQGSHKGTDQHVHVTWE
jgi:hypothetical protein